MNIELFGEKYQSTLFDAIKMVGKGFVYLFRSLVFFGMFAFIFSMWFGKLTWGIMERIYGDKRKKKKTKYEVN